MSNKEENLTNDEIWRYFNSEINSIKTLIEVCNDVESAFDIKEAKCNVSKLQTFVTSKVSQMPAYDVRRTQEMIEQLNKQIKVIETSLKPKKKFVFSSLSNKLKTSNEHCIQENSLSNNLETINCTNKSNNSNHRQSLNMLATNSENSKTIQNLSGQVINLQEINTEIQLLISDSKDSTIIFLGVLDSFRIERCFNITVIFGPCRTSAYIDNVTNSKLYLSCHQLRVHNCNNISFYVKVNSHPIIEDCTNLGFAPYDVKYPNIQQHFQEANLTDANNWDNVVDFRWHKATQSPNWFILPEKLRIKSSDLLFSYENSTNTYQIGSTETCKDQK